MMAKNTPVQGFMIILNLWKIEGPKKTENIEVSNSSLLGYIPAYILFEQNLEIKKKKISFILEKPNKESNSGMTTLPSDA